MNIVMIMLDSLRADFLACGGHPVVKTPHIDKVAQEGMFFEQAYAEYPITIPSRTAFVSGNYTFTNRPWCSLRSYDMHIAEVLKENDYATAAFADSPFMDPGMDRGFDTFVKVPEGKCHAPRTDKKYKFPQCYYPPGSPEEEKHFYPNTMINRFYAQEQYGKCCPELLFDQAIEWLEKNQKKPFFLWIDSFEPHEPWCPPSPYDTMYQDGAHDRYIPFPVGPDATWMTDKDRAHLLALYMGDVIHTDEQVGKVTAKLKKLGLEEDTMVVIASDHGEPFGEHGTVRKYGVPVYEELARILLIMKKPGLVLAGKRTKALVQNIDFAPTVLNILDIEPPKQIAIHSLMGHDGEEYSDGVSLLPLFRGEDAPLREEIYIGAFGLRSAIRRGQWKFIDHRGEKSNEVFDLENDPEEKINLIKEKRDLVKDLHYSLWKFQAKWSGILSWRDEPVGPRES